MKTGTLFVAAVLFFFIAVVLLLMIALIGGLLSVWGYLATNVVWFGLFLFFTWVVHEVYVKVEGEREDSDEETT